jgi:hypothetical protein
MGCRIDGDIMSPADGAVQMYAFFRALANVFLSPWGTIASALGEVFYVKSRFFLKNI